VGKGIISYAHCPSVGATASDFGTGTRRGGTIGSLRSSRSRFEDNAWVNPPSSGGRGRAGHSSPPCSFNRFSHLARGGLATPSLPLLENPDPQCRVSGARQPRFAGTVGAISPVAARASNLGWWSWSHFRHHASVSAFLRFLAACLGHTRPCLGAPSSRTPAPKFRSALLKTRESGQSPRTDRLPLCQHVGIQSLVRPSD